MITKILLTLTLVPCFAFARGQKQGPPPLNDEAKSAIEACGLSLPERGQRPSREEHEAIKSCLSEAGIERPSRSKRRRFSKSKDQNEESYSSGTLQ